MNRGPQQSQPQPPQWEQQSQPQPPPQQQWEQQPQPPQWGQPQPPPAGAPQPPQQPFQQGQQQSWQSPPMPSQPSQPMTPPPATGGGSSRLVLVIVVVAVVGVGGAMIPMFLASGTSCGGSNEPPVPLAINTPVQGTLSSAHPYRLYEIGITQPSQLTVSLNSQFDNYLELYAGDSQTPMMENDDGGSGLNAQLSTVLQPNVYYILVRPYSDGTGPFTITAAVMPVGQ